MSPLRNFLLIVLAFTLLDAGKALADVPAEFIHPSGLRVRGLLHKKGATINGTYYRQIPRGYMIKTSGGIYLPDPQTGLQRFLSWNQYAALVQQQRLQQRNLLLPGRGQNIFLSGQFSKKGPRTFEERTASALGKVVLAYVVNGVARPSKSDDLTTDLLKLAIGIGRDPLIESAIDDLDPNLPPKQKPAIRRAIGLIMEGRLTPENLEEQTIREELVEILRQEDATLGNNAAALNFLYQLFRRQAQ